ncbi:MAG: hypothetical protein RIG62_06485 [Cyclobacteriaceae bacterium]
MEYNESLWQDAGIAAIILAVVAGIIWIGSVIWVYRDGRSRGLSSLTSLIITALVGFTFWPLTVFGWVLLRPKERVHA